MSEFPKKIWMSADTPWGAYERGYRDDIAYIRADLVDEIVSALKFLLTCKHGEFCDHYREAEVKSKAAIEALEES